MLTVKIFRQGKQIIFHAHEVTFGDGSVWFVRDKLPGHDTLVSVSDGLVYVMNQNGATVAKHDLDAERKAPIDTRFQTMPVRSFTDGEKIVVETAGMTS